MFTLSPPFWGAAAGDPYVSDVVALLHFDEADGTATPASALGSPTVNNDGSASAPTTNAVKSTSARFGAGGWLSAGGGTGLKVSETTGAAAPYTIEFFFKPVTFGAFGRFFNVASSGSGVEFGLAAPAGAVKYVDVTGTNQNTTGSVSTGTWYFMAVCFDGTNVRVYQDGTLIFTSSAFARGLSSTTVTLGMGCSVGMGGADGTASFDELRWTHGVDRSAGGTTPPTTPAAEFPNS